MTTLGLFGSLGPVEIGVILLIGILLFGKRLPEVGRGLGKSIVEFKKGLKDVTDEIDVAAAEAKKLPKEAEAAPKPIEETQSETTVSRSDPVGS